MWDWAAGRTVSRGNGHKGTPPQVLGAEWDPHLETGEERFVTFGVGHLKAWQQVCACVDSPAVTRGLRCMPSDVGERCRGFRYHSPPLVRLSC